MRIARALRRPDPILIGLGLVLAGAVALRAWGIKQGLPYAYNVDEDAHFVPPAIGMFGHNYNPGYFLNPPAYTYLLHLVFAVWFGGRGGVGHAYAAHPTEVFVVGRATAGVLGVIAVWLLYLAGARLFDRRTALLSAALLAFAFLPVFYSHLALNDVPTLAPVALGLLGTALALRGGRVWHYALAGAGVGLAAATKYTGGIVLLPLLAVAGLQLAEPRARRAALVGLGVALVSALAFFLIANPFAAIDFHQFREGVRSQANASAGSDGGKLGLTQNSGIVYYLWTFTWGLGWAPAIAALLGGVLLIPRDWRMALILVPAPIVFLIFMGTQQRYFGRWLMPVLPIAALLAAYAAFAVVDAVRSRRPRLAVPAGAVLAAGLLFQPLWTSIRNDVVLARADTRALARAWMVANVPAGSKIVLEPAFPNSWLSDPGRFLTPAKDGARWRKFHTSTTTNQSLGTSLGNGRTGRVIRVEDYERTLSPRLISSYRRGGFCWVVTGSTQYGRAYNDPKAVPDAIAYYAALRRASDVVYHGSPWAKPVKFNFDWSFDYYPGAYRRPGAEVTVYKLRGCPA
jgi:Dolichyl-phosphate-mannose-protein mannosyltransferase